MLLAGEQSAATFGRDDTVRLLPAVLNAPVRHSDQLHVVERLPDLPEREVKEQGFIENSKQAGR